MKISYFYLFLFSILLVSCNEEEDQLPQSFLDGTYELARENTDTNIWYASQYVFKSDGTFETFQYARNSKDGPNLGVTSYSKGTYSLRGEEFTVTFTESYAVDYEKYPEGIAPTVTDLDRQEASPSTVIEGTLNQLEDGAKISILYECNDILSNCIGTQEYVKVD